MQGPALFSILGLAFFEKAFKITIAERMKGLEGTRAGKPQGPGPERNCEHARPYQTSNPASLSKALKWAEQYPIRQAWSILKAQFRQRAFALRISSGKRKHGISRAKRPSRIQSLIRPAESKEGVLDPRKAKAIFPSKGPSIGKESGTRPWIF